MKVKLKHYVNDHLEERSSAEHSNGIRAVERDRFTTSLVTPNFATYVENMMKNETNVLSNKLKRAWSSDHNARETTKVKHNRTTLLELFQKTKLVEETKSNAGKHQEQKTDNHLMRKILTTSNSESASADEKLHKILQMVHLEAMAISENMRKYVNRRKMKPEDIIIFPCPANQTRSKVSYAATNWKRERWIKSDAEWSFKQAEVGFMKHRQMLSKT